MVNTNLQGNLFQILNVTFKIKKENEKNEIFSYVVRSNVITLNF